MENVTWSRREKTADGVCSELRGDATSYARDTAQHGKNVYSTVDVNGSRFAVRVEGATATWTPVDGAVTDVATGSGVAGVRPSKTAQPADSAKKLERAQRIRVSGSSASLAYFLVNENATNWVILDSQDKKVGQFTGFHSGVRNVELDFSDAEPGVQEPDREDVVFLAWLARYLLESKLDVRSTIFIATLGLLTIIALLVMFVF